MDLFKDFTEIIRDDLLRYGYDSVKGCKPEDILFTYLNLGSKLINHNPKRLFISDKIKVKKSELGQVERDALNQIYTLFRNGGDVNPFLSKTTVEQDFQDYLLNDWGIHHLHLNGTKSN